MISDVSREELLGALERFDDELRDTREWASWESQRNHRYAIEHDGRLYPVRQILRLATGRRTLGGHLDPSAFLVERGFTVRTLHSGPAEFPQRRILAVSPGEAPGDWDACLRGGYLPIGWEELGDLRTFGDREAFLAAFRDRFGPLYQDLSGPTAKLAEELWLLRSLEPGDLLVARRATDEVLGLGEVVAPGYFRNAGRDLPGQGVRVRWSTEVAHRIPPQAGWSDALVTPVSPALLELILGTPRASVRTDLAAIHRDFSQALRDSHLDFGADHERLTRSFLASLATRPMVVLTGLSGSGKTQLALRFGEWLGMGRSLVVPVRPDWTGPEAVLGFEDALQPSLGGRRAWHVPQTLAFLLRAAAEPLEPYLLVLDEMNLAHVERYLSDLLSGMESGAPFLPALERHANGRWYPRLGAPRLAMPRNVLIVGTVNVDETTFPLSPKVLDRANTFEFRVTSAQLQPQLEPPTPCAPGPLELTRGLLALATDASWPSQHAPPQLELLAQRLRTVHALLAAEGFEFGHRVFSEALRFAAYFAAAGEPDADVALDLQLMQRVLPRLQGSRRRLEALLLALGHFSLTLEAPGAPPSHSLFEAPPRAPRLALTFAKLKRMMRSLQSNPFVSFAE